MRPIKFRAFINGKMTEDDFVLLDKKWCVDEKRLGCPVNVGLLNMEENEIPIMQFTGLHDKNGKEIWEGDLIRSIMNGQPIISEVFWVDDNAGFCNPSYDQPEVIGNIYENPELLEKK